MWEMAHYCCFRALGTGIFIVHDYDSGGGDGDGMTELLEWVKRMIFLGIFLTIFAAGAS